jgi:predicted  nucleic acid-binding Zn-ribbon protein
VLCPAQREIEALKQRAERLADDLRDSEKRAVDFDAARKELRETLDAMKTTQVGGVVGKE